MSTFTLSYKGNLRYLFAFLLLISCSMPAMASFTWQGPYAGAYLGNAFANNRAYTNTGTVTDTSYFATSTDINAVNSAGTWKNNPDEAIVGIQMGHDWVWKQLVYGIVFDYGSIPLSSSKRINAIYPDNSDTYSIYTSISTNWLFTLRGRLGYSLASHWPSLLYLTGGPAITQLKINNHFSDTSSFAGTGGNPIYENKIGWTAGAGIEVMSFKHISLDIEYLYIQIPSAKTTSSISNTQGGFGIPIQSFTSPFSTTGKFRTSLLKIELNYRFDE